MNRSLLLAANAGWRSLAACSRAIIYKGVKASAGSSWASLVEGPKTYCHLLGSMSALFCFPPSAGAAKDDGACLEQWTTARKHTLAIAIHAAAALNYV
jgi:hypothetical protein